MRRTRSRDEAVMTLQEPFIKRGIVYTLYTVCKSEHLIRRADSRSRKTSFMRGCDGVRAFKTSALVARSRSTAVGFYWGARGGVWGGDLKWM